VVFATVCARFQALFPVLSVADGLLPASLMNSKINSADGGSTAVRDALLERFRCEMQHTPGLALTAAQAARLFAVPPDVCGRILGSLAQEGAICLRPDGRFTGYVTATYSPYVC